MHLRATLFGIAALGLFATAALAAPDTKMMKTAIGSVLTDAKGMTLYTFAKDAPGKSNCYDKCAVNWPPFAVDTGAMAEGDYTIVDRTDGTKMWAYKGMPLYHWIKDTKPGDTTGDGFGGVWHVVK